MGNLPVAKVGNPEEGILGAHRRSCFSSPRRETFCEVLSQNREGALSHHKHRSSLFIPSQVTSSPRPNMKFLGKHQYCFSKDKM